MFTFALSSGISRGGGFSSGWPPKRGSTVHLKYMCMFSFIQMLKEKGYKFDVAFTSVLKRAIKTLFLIQEELDLHWIPVERHWRLNERHYGALQGLNKAETAAEHGEDQVKVHIYTQHIHTEHSTHKTYIRTHTDTLWCSAGVQQVRDRRRAQRRSVKVPTQHMYTQHTPQGSKGVVVTAESTLF